MKKIISLLAATMMMFSFATISLAEGELVVKGSDAAVAVNSTDNVDVKFTFTFPEEVGLLGFQPDITFDKTALSLKSYTLSGDVDWSTSDSNTNAAHGAYLSFDDTNYVGTTPVTEYVLTLTFAVADTSKAATYEVGFNELVGTDINYSGLIDNYTFDVSNVKSTITVKADEPTVAPEYFNANFTAGGPKYNGNKGMEFFFNSAKLNKVASYIFNFDEMFKDATFEAETEVDVAIKVNDVPEDDTVTLTGYEWSELGR